MEISSYSLSTEGILLKKFSEKDMLPLKNEIRDMLDNSANYKAANNVLAGHIEKEYHFTHKTKEYLQSLVAPLAGAYNNLYPEYLSKFTILTQDLPFTLRSAWVNFQKKYEFNPVHNHSGLFSFVIWVSVPYLVEDERNLPWCKNSNSMCPGEFEIFFSDTMGGMRSQRVPADKRYQNHILFFPSSLYHCVYPFYTSDDYRISISGNIFLQV